MFKYFNKFKNLSNLTSRIAMDQMILNDAFKPYIKDNKNGFEVSFMQ